MSSAGKVLGKLQCFIKQSISFPRIYLATLNSCAFRYRYLHVFFVFIQDNDSFACYPSFKISFFHKNSVLRRVANYSKFFHSLNVVTKFVPLAKYCNKYLILDTLYIFTHFVHFCIYKHVNT